MKRFFLNPVFWRGVKNEKKEWMEGIGKEKGEEKPGREREGSEGGREGGSGEDRTEQIGDERRRVSLYKL